MKKPMDFDEIREFGIKVALDRENLKETKRAEDETEIKKQQVAEFYGELLKKFPKKTKKKPEGHEEHCECEECANIDKIDYYEIEAQVKMIQADQRREEGKHWNTVKKQYGMHIRENFLPKTSLKKKYELEMALRDKKMPFAKADAHLPILGMVINEKNYPISPKHLKLKNQDQLE